MIRQFIFIAICMFSLSACTTTYYISRHAEKLNSTSNTPLSTSGHARAQALKNTLSSKGIDNIYVSNYLRTQQTAQPLTTSTGISMVEYDATPQGIQNLITRLKSHGDSRQILVVNHSNYVPVIIDSLMKSPQNIYIPENEFDNLYIVKVHRGLRVTRRFSQINYGVTTP